MRKVIKRTIEISGVHVGNFFEVGNGKEALEILQEEWVDIIISDINMPVMDGITFMQHLQKDPLVATIPVLVITTEGREDYIKKIMSIGAKAFVKKPFRPEEFRKVFLEVMGIESTPVEDESAIDGCDF
jgi:two-component system chemotaxis response regulator CheY